MATGQGGFRPLRTTSPTDAAWLPRRRTAASMTGTAPVPSRFAGHRLRQNAGETHPANTHVPQHQDQTWLDLPEVSNISNRPPTQRPPTQVTHVGRPRDGGSGKWWTTRRVARQERVLMRPQMPWTSCLSTLTPRPCPGPVRQMRYHRERIMASWDEAQTSTSLPAAKSFTADHGMTTTGTSRL